MFAGIDVRHCPLGTTACSRLTDARRNTTAADLKERLDGNTSAAGRVLGFPINPLCSESLPPELACGIWANPGQRERFVYRKRLNQFSPVIGQPPFAYKYNYVPPDYALESYIGHIMDDDRGYGTSTRNDSCGLRPGRFRMWGTALSPADSRRVPIVAAEQPTQGAMQMDLACDARRRPTPSLLSRSTFRLGRFSISLQPQKHAQKLCTASRASVTPNSAAFSGRPPSRQQMRATPRAAPPRIEPG